MDIDAAKYIRPVLVYNCDGCGHAMLVIEGLDHQRYLACQNPECARRHRPCREPTLRIRAGREDVML